MIAVEALEALGCAVLKAYEVVVAVDERGNTVSPSIRGMEAVIPIWRLVVQPEGI